MLLTHEDLEHHERHLNARNTLVTLLGHGVVPIINENDAVSFTEIKFGDNDKLSALVASLLPADLLVILTTVDGVIENFGKADARTISVIEQIDARLEGLAGGTDSETAVGGMASKIQAAKIVVRSGIPLVIASGKKKTCWRTSGRRGRRHAVRSATERLAGTQTLDRIFPSSQRHAVRGRRREEGACVKKARACCRRAWRAAKANLPAGDVVRICDLDGHGIRARHRAIRVPPPNPQPQSSPQAEELVHRDDLVILVNHARRLPAINDLLKVMAQLRSPTGCPWDREQDHQTLRWHAVEEVYELMDAIEAGDDHEMAEELGDLLLQVVFPLPAGEGTRRV